jgi:hypothetical protein
MKGTYIVFGRLEKWRATSGAGQEKHIQELSVTPVAYFTGAIVGIENRDYFAWRK